MKRFLILSVCIVLCSSLVARAELMAIYDRADDQLLSTVNVIRTVATGSLDKLLVSFKLSGIDQPAFNPLGKVAGYTGVSAVQGRGNIPAGDDYGWFAVTSMLLPKTRTNLDLKGLMVPLGNLSDFPTETKFGSGRDPNTSWVNFPSAIAGTMNEATGIWSKESLVQFARNGVGGVNGWNATDLVWMGAPSDYLRGMWYTDLEPKSPSGSTTAAKDVATMYVKTGDGIQFHGELQFINTTTGGKLTPFVYLAPIPEPSTLVLLGMGLLGLVCYAWRKR